MTTNDIAQQSDDALNAAISRAAGAERGSTATLLQLIDEVDRRRLYLARGYSSMFVYCTRALRLSEQAAYSRITAARAARAFPRLIDDITAGRLTLSSIGLLAPHLTDGNADSLIDDAIGRSTPRSTAAPTAPISPTRYLLKVTISAHAQETLTRLRGLMRHTIPTGDPAAIVERALGALLENVERTKLANVARPRPSSGRVAGRTIPAAVRRAVWRRDQGRCTFDGIDGRCSETGFLEFHHVIPFAAGGPATIENIQLRCRAHNAYEAMLFDAMREAG